MTADPGAASSDYPHSCDSPQWLEVTRVTLQLAVLHSVAGAASSEVSSLAPYLQIDSIGQHYTLHFRSKPLAEACLSPVHIYLY